MFRIQTLQLSKLLTQRKAISQRLTTQLLKQQPLKQPFFKFQRHYVIVHKDLSKQKKEPRIRYIIYVVIISWVFIWFVSGQVDKKKPTQYLTEREFQEYEKNTGIKRRNKLISSNLNKNYKFYVIPFITSEEEIQKIEKSMLKHDPSKKVKIIDPQELIKEEKNDDGKRYSALLNELDTTKKPYPPGLITAIIKEYIKFYINTREGTFDTNFLIINYPQTTNEAIKFENDISNISKCFVMHFDMLNELPQSKNDSTIRNIKNVDGYFETVGKSQILVSKFDEMDAKFEEIMLEDL
ncbi:AIM36 [Candida pseudojiufengensis]|uniref:AIM36 n=1 Tax=Candida pseudojiufengensis TaxID=497109 RepID=UPI0022253D6F|nr:AIM36 [Candida pseudojiufengensis]KAI5960182.1 AIM36 [Candida pseudojiufengensis]